MKSEITGEITPVYPVYKEIRVELNTKKETQTVQDVNVYSKNSCVNLTCSAIETIVNNRNVKN